MEMDSGLYQVRKSVFQTSSFRVTVHEEFLICSSNALDLQDPQNWCSMQGENYMYPIKYSCLSPLNSLLPRHSQNNTCNQNSFSYCLNYQFYLHIGKPQASHALQIQSP